MAVLVTMREYLIDPGGLVPVSKWKEQEGEAR